MQDVGPQLPTSLLSTHLSAQTWKPILHINPHAPFTHAAAPFGSVGQAAHIVPQPVASLSAAQRFVHRCVPGPQVKSQAVPSQLVALAPGGLAHPTHDVTPHVLTLVLAAQTPPQLCVPAGHWPEQAAAMSTHAPTHSFIPVGHAGTHAVPSHVTEPSVGAWQAWQDVVPQLPMSLLLTQRLPQMCVPVLHTSPQAPPTHCAAPFGSVAHATHEVPQAVASSSRTHRAPHWWYPVAH